MIVALFFVAFLQISSASTQPQISNANAEILEVLGEIVNDFCETEEITDSVEWFFENCPELKQAVILENKIPRLHRQQNKIEENWMKTVKKRLLWLKPPKDVSMKLVCMNGRIIIFNIYIHKTFQLKNPVLYNIYAFSVERCERLPKKVSFRR